MKTLLRCLVLLVEDALISPDTASSCSCAWLGGFLKIGPQCPVIVRGVVKSYHGKSRGMKLEMDVDVQEVLKGNVAEKTLRIRGDNAMLCRAAVEQFALGGEYIFALDGPGSKPGYDGGPAILACGQYWLVVRKGRVVGGSKPDSAMGEGQERAS